MLVYFAAVADVPFTSIVCRRGVQHNVADKPITALAPLMFTPRPKVSTPTW